MLDVLYVWCTVGIYFYRVGYNCTVGIVHAKMLFEFKSTYFQLTDITLLTDIKKQVHNLSKNICRQPKKSHFYQPDSQLCCGYGFTHSTDFKGQNYRAGADKEIPGLRSGPAAPHPIK